MLPNEILAATPDHEIITTRLFDAPVGRVYKAWSDPVHLANWWGPKGFTNTFPEFDLQPGGHWRFVMHGPEAGHYKNECMFLMVEPEKRLIWNRITQPLFQVVVLFEALEKQTKVTFKMVFETEQECTKLRKFVPEKNEENFDKLDKPTNPPIHQFTNPPKTFYFSILNAWFQSLRKKPGAHQSMHKLSIVPADSAMPTSSVSQPN